MTGISRPAFELIPQALTASASGDKLEAVQLTIEIPDDLAKQLEPRREHLVEIIRRGLGTPAPGTESAIEEVIQFLARRPEPEEILAFHASEKWQSRLRELLDKNREGSLTATEEAELDTMTSLNHLFSHIKLQARQRLGTGA